LRFSPWCLPCHATCNRRKVCAGHCVWQSQTTHVFASQFSSQTGMEDIASPPQLRLKIKVTSFISLTEVALEKLLWRLGLCTIGTAWRFVSCRAEWSRITQGPDPVPFYISCVSLVASVLLGSARQHCHRPCWPSVHGGGGAQDTSFKKYGCISFFVKKKKKWRQRIKRTTNQSHNTKLAKIFNGHIK